jgi:hypothetical protein
MKEIDQLIKISNEIFIFNLEKKMKNIVKISKN